MILKGKSYKLVTLLLLLLFWDMFLTSFHPSKALRHKGSVGRVRRCVGPLFLLKGSQRLLCSDLKHIKSLSHGCVTFMQVCDFHAISRVSDVC